MTPLLQAVTREGDLVLDPFLGSGATVVAGKLLGRRCIDMELDASYVEIACRHVDAIQPLGSGQISRPPLSTELDERGVNDPHGDDSHAIFVPDS